MMKLGNYEDKMSKHQFPVVGIGASAGGLKAVQQLLASIPEQSGMAYVFVQHLSPTHESELPEILQRSSRIPVLEITDNIHLLPDHFYIIPENRILTSFDGVLCLKPLNEQHGKVKIVDHFFSSLALAHQSFAIGVVLSGALDDGTLGLQAIKAYGGITFAQEQSTAVVGDMPRNAIKAGVVDFVLPPEQIVQYLMQINLPFRGHPDHTGEAPILQEQDTEIFKQLLTVLRERRGVDFTFYKPSTLKRRIVRRMALNNIGHPADYLTFIRDNKTEQDALYNDMLISVTQFFRDPASFQLLCQTILPALVKQKTGNEPLRVWVAGCATGEEAYSIAICLQEQLGDKAATMKIQIFATDISETAISKARTGVYRPIDMEGVSHLRLAQFFTRTDGNYHINKQIRDMCVFAQHNLLKDPPFSRIDLISCRNVMIYLEPVLQKRALSTFHYALNDQGFLLLGKSESIGKNTDLFTPYDLHQKTFRRNGLRGRFIQTTTPSGERNFRDIDNYIKKEDHRKDIFKIADEMMLAKYTPSGVLINDHFDILQFRGVTNNWLAPSPGKASLNLLKMVNDDLAFELRNLLHLARKNNAPAHKENILFHFAQQNQYVNMEVVPLLTEDIHYLVLFERTDGMPVENNSLPSDHLITTGEKNSRDQEIIQLRRELLQLRSDMKRITEEQEVVNEELQSANEELLSGSEELQSLNEELETSKEELQSTNEEITIVNNELLDRNEQLTGARLYTEGIINTIRDPLVILDVDLRVKRATEGFYNRFRLKEKETEGQYFYEIGNRQWDIPEVKDFLKGVLPERRSVADFEIIHIFPYLGYRVMHLNARQQKLNREEVILLSIEDVTDRRKVEEGLAAVERLFKENKERLKLAIDAARLGTWDYNALTRELILDKRSKEIFGILLHEETGFEELMRQVEAEDQVQVRIALGRAIAGRADGEYEMEFRMHPSERSAIKWIKTKGKVYFDIYGKAERFVGTSMDITDQKIHEQAVKELLKQKDDFISIASHELKTPITTLKTSLQLITRLKEQYSPEVAELVARASKSLDRVNVLVEDLLNVSKLNQGHLPLNRTNFRLFDSVRDSCQHIMAEGKYNIIIDGPEELMVYADVHCVEQIVVNFVNNAIKYAADSNDIKIVIEDLGSSVKASFIDKGPGIEAGQLKNLFKRYYRVETANGNISGLGLGLYICSEIIKKHDGRIGVESTIGKGSTFWFTLPKIQDKEQDQKMAG